MDILVLNDYYLKSGFSREQADRASEALNYFQNSGSKKKRLIEDCDVNTMKQHIQSLTKEKRNTVENLLSLARSAYLSENRELYIYFTQILERENIITNLKDHIIKVLEVDKAENILKDLESPEPGAPPEEAIGWTQNLIKRMDENLDEDQCREALSANAHGIPPEAFNKEVEYFQKATDLDSYLKDSHKRSVSTLQEHADTGKIWFEQIITQPVVDYVAADREILGGVLEEGKIYWTKIPYDTVAWLSEVDDSRKRYYACHCPMAREVLLKEGESIPGKWCNCTAGFVQQRFNAIFGETVKVDLLDSVLKGDDRCRFAITVPEKYL